MFYGSGAGKLPTASAVVSDVIEAAKNPARSMMAVWSEEKLHLEPKEEMKQRFFVRIKGTVELLKEELQKTFGDIVIVQLDEAEDEFGFVTPVMEEGQYEKCAAQYHQICQMIRVEM